MQVVHKHKVVQCGPLNAQGRIPWDEGLLCRWLSKPFLSKQNNPRLKIYGTKQPSNAAREEERASNKSSGLLAFKRRNEKGQQVESKGELHSHFPLTEFMKIPSRGFMKTVPSTLALPIIDNLSLFSLPTPPLFVCLASSSVNTQRLAFLGNPIPESNSW